MSSSIDCRTWTEEEALYKAGVYGDMDGLEYLSYQRIKEMQRDQKEILKIVKELLRLKREENGSE